VNRPGPGAILVISRKNLLPTPFNCVGELEQDVIDPGRFNDRQCSRGTTQAA
jgi:hypothetical protein